MLKVLSQMLLVGTFVFSSCPWASAQLPPTNMGKFVHQPGDNQYSNQTQAERHAQPPQAAPRPAAQSASGGGGGGSSAYTPVRRAPKPDYSIMPITCDEPIKPAGFPPIPDRLDFGNMLSYGRFGAGSAGAAGGVPSGTMGRMPGQAPSGPPQPTGVHQHYTHYDPGAFVKPDDSNSRGGYKVQTPGTDYYSGGAKPDANAGAPQFSSSASSALNQLGKEPRLMNDRPVQPEAPQGVVVNQSTTQDLSLPDDQFSSGQAASKNNNGNRAAKQVGQMILNPIRNSVYSVGSMGSSYGSMLMHH